MDPSDVAAWAGAVAGFSSLGWQAFSRRRSAHRIVVKRHAAYVLTDAPGLRQPMIQITAHNLGANAVTITGWGLKTATGNHVISARPVHPSTPVPHRLEAGAEASFFFVQSAAGFELARRGDDPAKARAFVRLATLETIRAKRGVPVEEPEAPEAAHPSA